jgi:hypothetical protein
MKQVRFGNGSSCSILGRKDANQIVLLYPSDPMLEGPACRFRREARAREDTSNVRVVDSKERLTANGRIEKLPKVVRGVKFQNGVEVIETPAYNAA